MQTHTITQQGKSTLEISIPDWWERLSLPCFEEWLEALRSSKYQQGTEYLCRFHRYCCLGVLCKIQGRLKEHGDFTWDIYDGEKHSSSFLSPQNPNYPLLFRDGRIPSVIRITNGSFDSIPTLTTLNDQGYSFETIAKVIELIWKA